VKFAVSIKFMWGDMPLPERARRAAAHGFDRVDLWDWRGEDIDGLAEVCRETGLEIACVFGHARGALCDPAQHDDVLASLAETVAAAERYGFLQLSMFSDARGPVSGDVAGNVLNLRYRLVEGGVSVEQTITLHPGGRTAHNRMTFRRFGLNGATVEETIRRVD
jgi:sugar phosphate isomerase/epimerase